MKINKNSTLAFIGGMLLASSVSMFAANTIDNNTKLNTQYPCGAGNNKHRGMRGMGFDNASSTRDMMGGHGMMNNLTDSERQAMRDKMDTNVSQVLGISKEALVSARNASTSMETLIKNAGLTDQQFHDKLRALMGTSTSTGRGMMWR